MYPITGTKIISLQEKKNRVPSLIVNMKQKIEDVENLVQNLMKTLESTKRKLNESKKVRLDLEARFDREEGKNKLLANQWQHQTVDFTKLQEEHELTKEKILMQKISFEKRVQELEKNKNQVQHRLETSQESHEYLKKRFHNFFESINKPQMFALQKSKLKIEQENVLSAV